MKADVSAMAIMCIVVINIVLIFFTDSLTEPSSLAVSFVVFSFFAIAFLVSTKLIRNKH